MKKRIILFTGLAVFCFLAANAAGFGSHQRVTVGNEEQPEVFSIGNQFPLGQGNSYQLSGISGQDNTFTGKPDGQLTGVDASRQAIQSGRDGQPIELGGNNQPVVDLEQETEGIAQRTFSIFI